MVRPRCSCFVHPSYCAIHKVYVCEDCGGKLDLFASFKCTACLFAYMNEPNPALEVLEMRTFESGATRDTDQNKPDYEGFLSPQVLRAYGQYMLKHQKQADGQLRASDNWQKGIPRDAYMKSMFRHFVEVWDLHRAEKWHAERGETVGLQEERMEALNALLFNVMGYMYEQLNDR